MNGSEAPQQAGALRRRIMLTGAGILAVMAALTAWGWLNVAPDARVPVHWNLQGEVDRYGSRWEALIPGPAIQLFLTLLFVALPALEPRRRHLKQSRRPYAAVFLASSLFMLLLHALMVATALGMTVDVPRVVSGGVGALLAVTGNYLAKLRSNFFIGIRTPWTLSSELAWHRTHRVGGKVFVAVGLLMIVAVAVPAPGVMLAAGSGLLGVAVLGLVVYSYVSWRQDPHRLEDGADPRS